MADQLVRVTGWEGGAYATCVRASCSGRLADDRPMSRLSDSSVILTLQFWVRSIILMLLLIQMSNMSNLSLCQNCWRRIDDRWSERRQTSSRELCPIRSDDVSPAGRRRRRDSSFMFSSTFCNSPLYNISCCEIAFRLSGEDTLMSRKKWDLRLTPCNQTCTKLNW